MNISVKGDYALHAIFDLALQKPGEPIRIADVARRQKIPQKFLELILAGLKQGGFVESRRGAEGGYLLSRAPDAITVGEVLRFVTAGGRSVRGNLASRRSGAFKCDRPHNVRRTGAELAGQAVEVCAELGDLNRAATIRKRL